MTTTSPVATNNSFSLFGMTTSDSINAIIAVVAIVGFIASLIISIITLSRTKKIDKHNKFMQERQIKIDLFNARYELFFDIFLFFYEDDYIPKTSENHAIVFLYYTKLPLLFNNDIVNNLITLCNSLLDYYNDKDLPLPDYTDKIRNRNIKKDSVHDYAFQCLNDIREHMML